MRLETLGPWWDHGRRWWGDRSSREQILLGALAVIGMVALLLVAVVRPLQSERARAAADIRTYDMLAMRLRAAGPGLAATGQDKGQPADIVARNAAAFGLTVQSSAMENGKLRVMLADAPFDAIVRFVAAIERTSRLRVAEAKIERSLTGSGGLTANFLLTI